MNEVVYFLFKCTKLEQLELVCNFLLFCFHMAFMKCAQNVSVIIYYVLDCFIEKKYIYIQY